MEAGSLASFQRGVTIEDHLRSDGAPPDLDDPVARAGLLDALVELLEALYPHLPAKRARYGIDPVQQLRLLRQRSGALTATELHGELARLLTGLRDAHTRYRGPVHAQGRVAVLPFLVEAYGPSLAPRYLVSKVGPRGLVSDDGFVAGVELVAWNGVPMDQAVDRWGEHETGGRPDSRRARALTSLTIRPLGYGAPPDERWVIVEYRTHGRRARSGTEVRFDWRVITPLAALSTGPASPVAPAGPAATDDEPVALDLCADAVRWAKLLLFAPQTWAARSPVAPGEPPGGSGEPSPATTAPQRRPPSTARRRGGLTFTEIPSGLPELFRARIVTTAAGPVGHLRLWRFASDDVEGYLAEAGRLLDELLVVPLIVDLRGNPGGRVAAAERLLQLFTPNRIEPTRFAWRATAVTRRLAELGHTRFEPWAPSLLDASLAEPYSQALPLVTPERCNDRGQRHPGPCLAVIDALTYSAGDLFAAGFVDNAVGELVTVGQATGGGGADLIEYEDLAAMVAPAGLQLAALPGGIGLSMAARRATRVGPALGLAIEDNGISGAVYEMTEQDLLADNEDLLQHCARRLLALPRSQLELTLDGASVIITAAGLDRVDLTFDGVPRSLPAADLPASVAVPAGCRVIGASGYAGSHLRQRRQLHPL